MELSPVTTRARGVLPTQGHRPAGAPARRKARSVSQASTSTSTTVSEPQLVVDDVVVRYGPRLVLDGLALVAGAGERLGVVGENGSGKTTLLRVLAGTLEADHGTVTVHGEVGLLAQQVDAGSGRTVKDLLAGARREIDDLQLRRADLEAGIAARPDQTDLLDGYGEVLEALEGQDAWTVDSRLAAAVDGLGLSGLDGSRALASLSGGQRHRLALAALLVRQPTVLLLDEPTTHLDDEAVAFLEARLRDWRGVVVAVSHDRVLLDAVATSVLDLDPSLDGRATRSSGGYAAYLVAKAAARERWELAHRDWQDEHDRLAALAKGSAQRIGHDNRPARDKDKHAPHFFAQRVDAAVSRRVKDAQQRLAELDRNKVLKPPAPLRFSSAFVARTGDTVLIQVRDLHVPGRVDLEALDVIATTRLLVEGPNGSGKSSLLAAMTGRLEPARGSVLRAQGVRLGLLAQHTVWPDPTLNVLSVFASGRGGEVDDHVAALLDVGLVHPRELRTPVGQMSVGQQRRVALARLVVDDPDVLLLDEPTDHLSLTLVEELETALGERRGALVVVTHDRWLRKRWTGERLALSR